MYARISFLLLFLLVGCSSVTTVPRRYVPTAAEDSGTYQRCPFHCETIHLDPDGRFKVVLDGDLYNNLSAAGNWVIDQSGYVILNTDQQPSVRESTSSLEGEIRFKISDIRGAAPPMAYGFVYCPESTGQWWLVKAELLTDDAHFRLGPDGFVHVTGCDPTDFFVELYALHNLWYSPQDPSADTFEFVFDTTTAFYLTSERYRWRPGLLYDWVPLENGGQWTELPLRLQEDPTAPK